MTILRWGSPQIADPEVVYLTYDKKALLIKKSKTYVADMIKDILAQHAEQQLRLKASTRK